MSEPALTALSSLDELIAKIRARQPRALARAISLLERGAGPEARELVHRLHPHTGRARVVGVTGPPGSGKSTLVDRLARLLRERGETVAVLAVDPSSPYTGGALLGDRIRMQTLYTDPGVFIRSMATRGRLGGLARATHDALDVLDAAGFDWLLVETVGVGQDEVDVVESADSVLVVVVPGLGDDVQTIKAGLMEIADVFVLNKADREGADHLHKDLEQMLGLVEKGRDEEGEPEGWEPPIVDTVASRGEGVEEVLAGIERHRAWLTETGGLDRRRRRLLAFRVKSLLTERILAAAEDAGLAGAVESGAAEDADPYRIADRVYDAIRRGAGSRDSDAVKSLDHIGIAVRSIEEARGFWEALGLEVEAIEEVPQEGVRVAFLEVGESRIELLEATSEDSPIAKFLEQRGPGIHHLCLRSGDVRADDARLREAGYQVLRPEPTRGAGGCWVQFVHPKSTGGVLLELSQGGHEE